MKKYDKSKAISKEPCPKCGSKDNLVRYQDGSAFCYTPECGNYEKPDAERAGQMPKVVKTMSKIQYDGEILAVGARKISLEQSKKYGVRSREQGTLIFPYYSQDGQLVSTKLRSPSKQFMYTGDADKLELFGQSKFGSSGKFLTITEGELDAMAARQMLGDFPVVSVHSSTMAERDIKNNIDFIEGYDKVVICMDNDDAGRKAAKIISELISPNKVLIATLTDHKDACDYLMAGDQKKFSQGWWQAKQYTPAGVVTLSEAFGKFRERLRTKIIEIPDYWGETKKMLNGGFAVGEITMITADTSVGKTTQLANLFEGVLSLDPSRHITALLLETTVAELVVFVNKKHFGITIDVGDDYTEEYLDEMEKNFLTVEWTSRLHVIEHVGSLSSSEEVIRRVRGTAVATGSDLILIDPLQQAVPNIDHEVIRSFMDASLKLAQQLPAALVMTSHIKHRSKKNAYDIIEDDAIGGSAIKQVAWTQILLSRDKMSTDDKIRNSTKSTVPKCRRTGRTGEGGWMLYDYQRGSFSSIVNPLTSDVGDDDDDKWEL